MASLRPGPRRHLAQHVLVQRGCAVQRLLRLSFEKPELGPPISGDGPLCPLPVGPSSEHDRGSMHTLPTHLGAPWGKRCINM